MQKIIYVLVVILIVAGLGFALGYSVSPGSPQNSAGVSPKSLDTQTLTVSGSSTLTGTTTVALSYDPFTIFDDVTVATTTNGGVTTVYTNSFGDMICDGNSGNFYSNATGFAPARNISVGEMSSTSLYSDGSLMASTTIATSTDTLTAFTATIPFLFNKGNSIVVSVGDTNQVASSTYLSNWAMELGINCRLRGQ